MPLCDIWYKERPNATRLRNVPFRPRPSPGLVLSGSAHVKATTTFERPPSGVTLSGLRGLLEYKYFGILTAVVTYGLIVLGGTVRATDSGTACPDWPLCHGQVVPPFETKVMIEYSHRLIASFVGLLILAMVIWGWRRYPQPLYRAGGILVITLLAGQVILGGVTVETETAASVVAAHLTMALTLFATLILMIVGAYQIDSGRPLPTLGGLFGHLRRLLILPLATLGGVLVLIIVGAYVSQMDAGLVYPDWPLFNGELVSSGGKLADIHYAHRVLAAIVGVLLLGLAWQVVDEDHRPVPLFAIGAAVALYVTQVIAGASNIWFDLATPVRILHLALASAVWGVIVVAVAYRHFAPVSEAPA
jgi:cytochrome c oxidase assembly protein subunit 15